MPLLCKPIAVTTAVDLLMKPRSTLLPQHNWFTHPHPFHHLCFIHFCSLISHSAAVLTSKFHIQNVFLKMYYMVDVLLPWASKINWPFGHSHYYYSGSLLVPLRTGGDMGCRQVTFQIWGVRNITFMFSVNMPPHKSSYIHWKGLIHMSSMQLQQGKTVEFWRSCSFTFQTMGI